MVESLFDFISSDNIGNFLAILAIVPVIISILSEVYTFIENIDN